jgi:Uma2 family endonuclease
MENKPRILKTLADLPWRNNFVWFPNGHGGGYLLHRNFTEEEQFEYWLYTIPNDNVSIAMYQSLPESAPFELHNNQLIYMAAPTPNHQIVSANLFSRLSIYIEDNELGKLLFAPVDVHFPEKHIIQPDLLFVSENWREHFDKSGLHTAPDWAAEILSPSTKKDDENFKLQLLSENGTVEYWIIDPEEQWVKQYVLDEETGELLLKKKYEGEDEVIESVAIKGFSISTKKIFKDVEVEK